MNIIFVLCFVLCVVVAEETARQIPKPLHPAAAQNSLLVQQQPRCIIKTTKAPTPDKQLARASFIPTLTRKAMSIRQAKQGAAKAAAWPDLDQQQRGPTTKRPTLTPRPRTAKSALWPDLELQPMGTTIAQRPRVPARSKQGPEASANRYIGYPPKRTTTKRPRVPAQVDLGVVKIAAVPYLIRTLKRDLEDMINAERVDVDDIDILFPIEGNTPVKKRALIGELKQRNEDDVPENPSKNDLLESLFSIDAQLSGLINHYAHEHSDEETKEMIMNVGFDIFFNWRNYTQVHTTNSKRVRADAVLIRKLSVVPRLLAVVSNYLEQCEDDDQECLTQFADVMHQAQMASQAVNPDKNHEQNLVLEAIGELVEKLENISDPTDEKLLLLAHALHKLQDDLGDRDPESTIQNNIVIILDLCRVLQLVDDCSKDPQCVYDCYRARNVLDSDDYIY